MSFLGFSNMGMPTHRMLRIIHWWQREKLSVYKYAYICLHAILHAYILDRNNKKRGSAPKLSLSDHTADERYERAHQGWWSTPVQGLTGAFARLFSSYFQVWLFSCAQLSVFTYCLVVTKPLQKYTWLNKVPQRLQLEDNTTQESTREPWTLCQTHYGVKKQGQSNQICQENRPKE